MVDRVIEMRGRGGRGGRGTGGGNLGPNTVGATEFMSTMTALRAMRDKLVVAAVPVALYSSLNAAHAAAVALGGRPLLFTTQFTVSAPFTITVPIIDTLEAIFSAGSAAFVTIDNGQPVRPEWFGAGTNGTAGVVGLACRACAVGGTVLLRSRRYQSGFDTAKDDGTSVANVNYLAKAISVVGTKTPVVNSAGTAFENGSVIEGAFYCAAPGAHYDKFGVDSGRAVTDAIYSGAGKDGFALFQSNKNQPVIINNVTVGHVRGLGRGGSGADSKFHAILMESVDGLIIDCAEAYYSGIGLALKSSNVRAGTLGAYECDENSIYLKSDTYAPFYNVLIDKIVSKSNVKPAGSTGLVVEAATSAVQTLQINSVLINNKTTPYRILPIGNNVVFNVRIKSIITDGCTNGGRVYGAQFSSIDNLQVLNAVNGVELLSTAPINTFEIGQLTLINISGFGVMAQGRARIGCVDTTNVATLFRYDGDNARISVGMFRGDGVGSLASYGSGSTVLAGSWAGDDYKAEPWGDYFQLRGSIAGGGTGKIIEALPPSLRPAALTRCQALGYNGTVFAPVEITIGTDGVVNATNFDAASTRLVLDGVRWKPAA